MLAIWMLRDALITLGSFWIALWLRFDGHIPAYYVRMMVAFSPAPVGLLVLVGLLAGLYESLPTYTSLLELTRLAAVVVTVTFGLLLANEAHNLVVGSRALPFSVPVVSSLFLLCGLGSARIYRRMTGYLAAAKSKTADTDRVLIVGAGDAGEHVARDLLGRSASEFLPVGFVDDDPAKLGRRIHGLPVLAPTNRLADAVEQSAADCVIIAIPDAPSGVLQDVLARVADAGVKAKILPSLRELMSGTPTEAHIRDVDISDLIARKPAKIDISQIGGIINGCSVLVTGAAGSIGSELARKALYFKPVKLIVLDNSETELFFLAQRLAPLAASRGTQLETVLADIRDRKSVDRVFASHRPNLVLHAAAYKHVPVMELHPEEAVITNVTGTRNVAEAASAFAVDRFVLVSTDKAVNPTSVMGATKRVAEMLMATIGEGSGTAFMTVRFGNVLASRGSVVPIFLQQIREGGPITVTHPDVTRYFMTIEEAVALIFQAAALGRGGETFVLEMGDPVRIVDLADRMRRLLGNGQADKIEIVLTGLRPGEKLHEDLFNLDDQLTAVHPGILQLAVSAEDNPSHGLDTAISMVERKAAGRAEPERLAEQLLHLATHGKSLIMSLSPLSAEVSG
jgi:FlaA1/EpsC-like NDP-sugar epimerase